ncbi:MAG: ABC transporter substrate-binding protein [Planctomycetota bacterium]
MIKNQHRRRKKTSAESNTGNRGHVVTCPPEVPAIDVTNLSYISAALLALAACAASTCTQVRASGSKALVIYTSIESEIRNPIVEAFEKANPNIAVEIVEIEASLALERLRANVNNTNSGAASVWWGADHVNLEKATREKLLAPIDPAWARTLAIEYRDPNGLWAGQFLQSFCIAYKQGSVNIASRFEELAEPRFQGRIVYSYPTGTNVAAMFLGGMLSMRGSSAESNRRAFDWFWMLDSNRGSEYINNPAALFDKILAPPAEGAVATDIAIARTADAVRARNLAGLSIDFVIPTDSPGYVDGIAKTTNAPFPAEADRFIDFVGRDEHISKYIQYGLVPLPAERINKSAVPEWMAAAVERTQLTDRTVLADQLHEWTSHFESRSAGAAVLPGDDAASVWWLGFIDIIGTALIVIVVILLLRRGGWTAIRTGEQAAAANQNAKQNETTS